jgi:competence protein ComEA
MRNVGFERFNSAMNIRELHENFQEYTFQQKRALFGISILAIAFAIFLFLTTRGSAVAQESPKPSISISSIQSTIFVHVAGKVKNPDVYPLLKGARVADAIKAAGGALKGVDTSDINLARILVDGEQVYVGYVSKVSATSKGLKQKFNGIVNINRGTKAEFDSLQGIGPVIAGRIVAYRNQNGSFMALEDLLKVSGIGPKTLERIRARLTL